MPKRYPLPETKKSSLNISIKDVNKFKVMKHELVNENSNFNENSPNISSGEFSVDVMEYFWDKYGQFLLENNDKIILDIFAGDGKVGRILKEKDSSLHVICSDLAPKSDNVIKMNFIDMLKKIWKDYRSDSVSALILHPPYFGSGNFSSSPLDVSNNRDYDKYLYFFENMIDISKKIIIKSGIILLVSRSINMEYPYFDEKTNILRGKISSPMDFLQVKTIEKHGFSLDKDGVISCHSDWIYPMIKK